MKRILINCLLVSLRKKKRVKVLNESLQSAFESGFSKLKDNVLITTVLQYINSDHITIAYPLHELKMV